MDDLKLKKPNKDMVDQLWPCVLKAFSNNPAIISWYSSFLEENDRYWVWSACLNDQPIGLALVVKNVDTADLCLIILDPAYRSLGYGGQFLDLILTSIQTKVKKFFLEVNQTNRPALALYQSRGFQTSHVRHNYYPDGDGLEMVKEWE